MLNKAKGWLATKTKQVIELVEHKMTMEIDTTVDPYRQKAFVVASVRKNIGSQYKPYIDCIDIEVNGPNWFESLWGKTFQDKVLKAQRKIYKKTLRRIEKGLTKEKFIMDEITERQREYFAQAV